MKKTALFIATAFIIALSGITGTAQADSVPLRNSVWAGDMLFVSGQIGFHPDTGKLVEGGTVAQAKQIFKQIDAVLKENGLTPRDVVKVNVFCTDLNDFNPVNVEYAKLFSSEPPARSFVQVAALPMGASIEIELIAYKKR